MAFKSDIPTRLVTVRNGTIRTRVDPVTYLIDFGGIGTEVAYYSGWDLLDVAQPVVCQWKDEAGMWVILGLNGVPADEQPGDSTSGGEFSWGVSWHNRPVSDLVTGPAGDIVDPSVGQSPHWVEGTRTQNAAFLSETLGYAVSFNEWWRTEDGGATWDAGVGTAGTDPDTSQVASPTGSIFYRIAWDGREDDGIIHIGIDSSSGTSGLFYRELDVATNDADPIHFALSHAASSGSKSLGIVVAKNGDIFLAGTGFGTPVAAKATDGIGETWAAVSAPDLWSNECLGWWPDASASDPNDLIMFLYGSGAYKVRPYDHSLDSWGTQTSWTTGKASPTQLGNDSTRNHSTAYRPSDGHIFHALLDSNTPAGASVEFYDSIGSTFTPKTDVWAGGGSDWVRSCALTIDTNEVITCFYTRDPENADMQSANIYYKTSSDGGDTWSDEAEYTSGWQDHIGQLFVDPGPVAGWGFVAATVTTEGTAQSAAEPAGSEIVGYTGDEGTWSF